MTVTARPNAGYEFVRWSGVTASTENPTTVVMSDNRSLVAFFTAILPTPTPTPTRVPTATPTRTPTPTATSVPVTFAAFGPTDGVLVHDPSDNSIEGRSSGVTLEDAIIETRFFNPYSTLEGSWSNGLLFRNSTFNTFHAVVITSSGNWAHSVRTGTVDSPPLQQEFSSSPSEDYLAVLAGQRQWIATTNFAGCPGQPQIALRIAPCSLPRQSS